MNARIHTKTYAQMFIAKLFIAAKKAIQMSLSRLINKLWYMPPVGSSSAIKSERATAWMNFAMVMLHGRSQIKEYRLYESRKCI